MSLTNTFNAAAGGSEGQAASVNGGPHPHGPDPSTPGVTGDTSARSPETETKQPDAIANATLPHRALGERSETQRDTQTEFNAQAARSELEALEAGRPKPEPHHRVNPPTQLKKIADNQAERQREARIGALKAYLEFREQNEPGPHEDAAEELDFRL